MQFIYYIQVVFVLQKNVTLNTTTGNGTRASCIVSISIAGNGPETRITCVSTGVCVIVIAQRGRCAVAQWVECGKYR